MWISQGQLSAELYNTALKLALRLEPCRYTWITSIFDVANRSGLRTCTPNISSGLILVFVQGESLGAETPLPGFRCESRAELDRLAVLLGEPVVDDGDYRSLASAEPEGNWLEVYWECS